MFLRDVNAVSAIVLPYHIIEDSPKTTRSTKDLCVGIESDCCASLGSYLNINIARPGQDGRLFNFGSVIMKAMNAGDKG